MLRTMTSSSTLHQFIGSLHSSLIAARSSSAPLAVVLGNQACDLDSVVSALVHARFNLAGEHRVALPLIQCKRSEFRLRSDTRAALQRCGGVDAAFAERELLFLHDDISIDDLLQWHSERRLSLALVDHNNAAATLPAALAHAVRHVVDHHVDEHRYVDDSLELKLIRPVGSCCSLIAQLTAHQLTQQQSDEFSQLLLTTIATDTVNFDAALKRATPFDHSIARFLFAKINPAATVSFEQYCTLAFEEISRAKNDVSALSASELLARDYKAVPSLRLGMSSLTGALETFPMQSTTLADFCDAQQIDTLIICTAVVADPAPFRRQLACFVAAHATDADARFTKLYEFLQSSASLRLEPLAVNGQPTVPRLALFEQRDLTASRKVIAPLVVDFLQTST
jgi:exopolyphosphatase